MSMTDLMKFDHDNDLLIIPDVHGRGFWREAVRCRHHAHLVFLGDYIDPYPHEGIYPDEALEEMKAIVEYAKAHRDTTTLLIGNHDMHYKSTFFRRMAGGTRYNSHLRPEIYQLMSDNADLFTLAFEAECEGVHCLFTHAGVATGWLNQYSDLVGEPTAENINRLLDSPDGIMALADIGWCRGGGALVGGPLWADYSEMAKEQPLPGIFQIFGHTQKFGSQPWVTEHLACLDCHRAFLLTEVLEMAHLLDSARG